MNRLICIVVDFLMNWCERRGRVLKITGTSGPDDIYLIRYFLVRSRWMNIYIHQFLRSDRDDLHDHPWHFMTYLVRGSYKEVRWNPVTEQEDVTYRQNYTNHILPNGELYTAQYERLVFRRATDQHMVVVDENYTEAEKHRAPLTLFISGPKIRDWGFIKNETLQKDGITPINEKYLPIRTWIPWRQYLGLPASTTERG